MRGSRSELVEMDRVAQRAPSFPYSHRKKTVGQDYSDVERGGVGILECQNEKKGTAK